jgi:hypothetical protein
MDEISSSQKNTLSLLGDPQVNLRLKKNLLSASDSNSIKKICEIIFNVLNKISHTGRKFETFEAMCVVLQKNT